MLDEVAVAFVVVSVVDSVVVSVEVSVVVTVVVSVVVSVLLSSPVIFYYLVFSVPLNSIAKSFCYKSGRC